MSTKNQPATSTISRRVFSAVLAGGMLSLSGSTLSQADEAKTTEHPLVPAIRHAKACAEKARQMKGYECSFSKKEVVGNEMVSQSMTMKVRHEPFSVYMKFAEPSAGREVIYVQGRNDNKLLVHETGFKSLVGTLSLAPEDNMVMAENRYPITKAGIVNMLDTVIAQWEEESKYGETDVKYFEDAKVGEYVCRVIESSHPQPRKQFKFQMTRLWIDEKSGLAVRVQQFGFPRRKDQKSPVIEDYTFTGIKPEVRLTDRDFDTNNPNYNY